MTPQATETQLGNFLLVRFPLLVQNALIFRRPIIRARATAGGRTWQAVAGVPGQADFYVVAQGGLHVEVETKSARGTLRAAQDAWMARCIALRIPYVLARVPKDAASPDDIIRVWCDAIETAIQAPGAYRTE